jgi:hypothetical protein
VKELRKLKKLGLLQVIDTRITEAGEKELKAALPDLDLVRVQPILKEMP